LWKRRNLSTVSTESTAVIEVPRREDVAATVRKVGLTTKAMTPASVSLGAYATKRLTLPKAIAVWTSDLSTSRARRTLPTRLSLLRRRRPTRFALWKPTKICRSSSPCRESSRRGYLWT